MDEGKRPGRSKLGEVKHGKNLRAGVRIRTAHIREPRRVSRRTEDNRKLGRHRWISRGLRLVTLAIATIALFDRRSAKYVLINGGYRTVSFVLMGLILGAWR